MRFQFRDFVLDTQRQELRRDDERIELERRVFAFLSLLLERRGEAVAKNEILDALWPKTATTEGSLTRAVRAVRRALRERADEAGTIRTVRGRGYAIGREVERVEEE